MHAINRRQAIAGAIAGLAAAALPAAAPAAAEAPTVFLMWNCDDQQYAPIEACCCCCGCCADDIIRITIEGDDGQQVVIFDRNRGGPNG